MRNRYKDHLEDGTNVYRQRGGIEYDERISPLIQRYQELFENIQAGSQETSSGWHRTEEVDPKEKEEMRNIKKALQEEQKRGGRGKNILSFSSWNDERIGHGKDNTVFVFGDGYGKLSRYVYKEAIPPKTEDGKSHKEMTGENLRYLQKKYILLKTFLGSIIPQSAFILGDVSRKDGPVSGLPNMDNARQTTITIQRRIKGKTLKQMSSEEKADPTFLYTLHKAHRQYVLLKMFIQTIAEEFGLPRDTLDVKMDLGRLSDIETLDIHNPTTLKEALKSPNIMYDGSQVYFIDFDQGEWSEMKGQLLEYLLKPDIQERWKSIKSNLGV